MIFKKKKITFFKKKFNYNISNVYNNDIYNYFFLKKTIKLNFFKINYCNLFFLQNLKNKLFNFLYFNIFIKKYNIYLLDKKDNKIVKYYNYYNYSFNITKKYNFFFNINSDNVKNKKKLKKLKKFFKKFNINVVLIVYFKNFNILYYFFKKYKLITIGFVDLKKFKNINLLDYYMITNNLNFMYKYKILTYILKINNLKKNYN